MSIIIAKIVVGINIMMITQRWCIAIVIVIAVISGGSGSSSTAVILIVGHEVSRRRHRAPRARRLSAGAVRQAPRGVRPSDVVASSPLCRRRRALPCGRRRAHTTVESFWCIDINAAHTPLQLLVAAGRR